MPGTMLWCGPLSSHVPIDKSQIAGPVSMLRTTLRAAITAGLIAAASAAAAAPQCEVDRPVRIAGLDWDSNRFHAAVAAFVLEHGFGCKTETLPGTTIPLLTGLGRGDLDIMLEVWKDQLTEAWVKAKKAGKVRLLGVTYPDAVQGWFVPRYLVEGDGAPAKGLRRVSQLAEHKALFRDPEEPDKGRFYNCKLGWECETVNTKKLAAYGLAAHFTNFRPGSGAALSAAIAAAYKRRKPILYYYWGPTWVLGKYDGVLLEEPACDADAWKAFTQEKAPKRGCAYPRAPVYSGANTGFVARAPRITAFLEKFRTSNALVSEALLTMQENRSAGEKGAALHFLRTREDVWSKWLAPDAARRVKAALD